MLKKLPFLSSSATIVALGVVLVTGSALAQRPTLQLLPQLTQVTVVGGEDGTLAAGAQVNVRLAGIGRCPVDIQVRPIGARALAHTQTIEATLGGREAYPLAYRMGPFEATSAVSIRAIPRAPCRGAVVDTTVSVARPRIVLPPRVSPTVPPSPTTAPATPSTPAAPAAPTTPPSGTTKPPTTPPIPPAPALPPGVKPATGGLASLSVPGGSFAEDEAQKLQIKGSGGCALNLHISNKTYGGSFDKTFAVNPMNLANSPTLYNGTHFDTLAEGSYHADATGKDGCTGTAATDFKVTAKNTNASVKGKPTLTLDKQPIAGAAFKKSKDSNIWFKVGVPTAFKDASAACCDVEWNYINAYGGWEVLPNSPFTDPGMNPLANNNSAVPKSVSGFTVPNEGATRWRMRVRGYRYKTAFEWSDWLEFSVDQN